MTANVLNGRAEPTKKATVEARFDRGDILTGTGEWSKDRKWVEVFGGETGVVWCDARYISEITEEIVVCNLDYKQIKLRKTPIDGKVIGYLKKGKELYIDRVVLGWGHSNRGWVDMSLVCEED